MLFVTVPPGALAGDDPWVGQGAAGMLHISSFLFSQPALPAGAVPAGSLSANNLSLLGDKCVIRQSRLWDAAWTLALSSPERSGCCCSPESSEQRDLGSFSCGGEEAESSYQKTCKSPAARALLTDFSVLPLPSAAGGRGVAQCACGSGLAHGPNRFAGSGVVSNHSRSVS